MTLKEEHRAANQRSYLRHREERLAKQKIYDHSEQGLATRHHYYELHKEEAKAKGKAWERAHRTPCVDCGTPAYGRRCLPCLNKTEGHRKAVSDAMKRTHREHPEILLNGFGTKTTVDGHVFPSKAQAAMWLRLKELGGDPCQENELSPIETPHGCHYPDTMLRNSVLDIPANVPLELKSRNGDFLWSKAQIWSVTNGEVVHVCQEDLKA